MQGIMLMDHCKIRKPWFRFAGKFQFRAAPDKPHGAGVECVVFKNQFRMLLRRQAVLDERHIHLLVATVKFVADDGMAEMREMDADLMFATGAGNEAQQGKSRGLSVKS